MDDNIAAEGITADQFPEVPETDFSKLIEARSSARIINIVALSQGGTLTRQQKTQRTKLLALWDKAPTVQRISALEVLTRFSFAAVVALMMAPSAEALTAYDCFDKPTFATLDEDEKLCAIVHTWKTPTGKKFHYYQSFNRGGSYYVTTKRLKKLNGMKIRDERPLDVIHPKLSKWRDRILFFGPFWTLFTDTAVKGAVGTAATGVSN